MEASELMVGDWVSVFDNTGVGGPMRVYDICGLRDNGYVFEPIPITPEILKKNGFEEKELILFDNERRTLFSWRDKDAWSARCDIQKYADGALYIEIENLNRDVYLQGYACRFAHELQHALRLCEIKLEVKL